MIVEKGREKKRKQQLRIYFEGIMNVDENFGKPWNNDTNYDKHWNHFDKKPKKEITTLFNFFRKEGSTSSTVETTSPVTNDDVTVDDNGGLEPDVAVS